MGEVIRSFSSLRRCSSSADKWGPSRPCGMSGMAAIRDLAVASGILASLYDHAASSLVGTPRRARSCMKIAFTCSSAETGKSRTRRRLSGMGSLRCSVRRANPRTSSKISASSSSGGRRIRGADCGRSLSLASRSGQLRSNKRLSLSGGSASAPSASLIVDNKANVPLRSASFAWNCVSGPGARSAVSIWMRYGQTKVSSTALAKAPASNTSHG